MDEQTSKVEILNKTLYTLIRQVGLTPEEVSTLRLSDLHLAGKSPSISVSVGENQVKTVELDLEAHRALVGWLVARPDSVSDFLFLGHGSEPMAPSDLAQAVEAAAEADLDSETPLETKITTPPRPDSSAEEKKSTDETRFSPPRPEPLPARPAPTPPPPTTPEAGVPLRDVGGTEAHPASPPPPVGVPEQGTPSGMAPPGSARPFPPPRHEDPATRQPPSGRRAADRFPRPVAPEPRPAPKPVGEKRPRVPPKPVRRKGSVPAPVIVPGKEPEQPSPPMSQEPAPPPAPVEEKISRPPEKVGGDKAEGILRKPAAQSGSISTSREPAKLSPPPVLDESLNRPAIFSFGLGGGLLILAVCVICVGGVGWFGVQSEMGANLLAGLGLVDEPVVNLPETPDSTSIEGEPGTSTFGSSLPTPTLPPTSTPTLLPPTNTPTATSTPQATEPPIPTDTPLPTDTPVPTNTPVPQPPPATPTPAETPTPVESPTPAMKYEAPVLLEPENGFRFNGGNTIVLRWQPVDLAPDEQYAVRLVYTFNNQITFQGANIKEPEWTIPLSLFGQIDGPDNYYEWFVVVERLNEDGSGTAISPESERRNFTWK